MARKPKATQEIEAQSVIETEGVVSNEKVEIPEWAEKILAIYPEHEKLYITPNGGAYVLGTPEIVRGNAELFSNPYFNK